MRLCKTGLNHENYIYFCILFGIISNYLFNELDVKTGHHLLNAGTHIFF